MLWIRSGIEMLRSRSSLAVVVGMKTPNDHAEPTKRSNAKKKASIGCTLLTLLYNLCPLLKMNVSY